MAVRYFEKENTDDVDFSEGNWDKTTNSDGSRTYTANADGASCTVKFRPPREDQVHTAMKTGSKVVKRTNGQVEVEHIR